MTPSKNFSVKEEDAREIEKLIRGHRKFLEA